MPSCRNSSSSLLLLSIKLSGMASIMWKSKLSCTGAPMWVRRMRASYQRQPMAIDNCHDSQTLTVFGRPDFIAQRACQIGHYIAQHFASTPLSKMAMHHLVVWIALWLHVPSCIGIKNLKEQLRASGEWESVCGSVDLREYAPPESGPGCVPRVCR